jgi:hypothetical protein
MLSLRLSCRTDGLKVGAGVASMPIFWGGSCWSWHKLNGKWLKVKPREDWRRMFRVRCCFAWKWELLCCGLHGHRPSSITRRVGWVPSHDMCIPKEIGVKLLG